MPIEITPKLVANNGELLKDHEVSCTWLQDVMKELSTNLPKYIIVEMPDAETPTVTFKVHPEWGRLAKEDGHGLC